MLLANWMKKSGWFLRVFHMLHTCCSRASGVLSWAWFHSFTIQPHTFSIGFRSGLLAGQRNGWKSPFSRNHCFTIFAVCTLQLSWTILICLCSFSGRAYVLTASFRFVSKTPVYSSAVIQYQKTSKILRHGDNIHNCLYLLVEDNSLHSVSYLHTVNNVSKCKAKPK